MKKRYVILAGILAAAVMICAGCGKESADEDEQQNEVTVDPADDAGDGSSEEGLVEMQQSTEEDIENEIGEATGTSSEIVLINHTGADVSSLYVRPHTDGYEWGDELINGMFTFENDSKALYYFEAADTDADGNAVTSYDIRIAYAEAGRNECYFRMIPLQNITQITLCMDGTGADSIPYATYLTEGSRTETSTLSEVRQRLGLTDTGSTDSDTEDGSTDSTVTSTPAPSVTPAATVTPGSTAEEPDDDSVDTSPSDAGATQAESFIGQSLESLIASCGEPTGSDYENEPETGETGYHYYDTFTVSTTVDENGNEVVAGVW